VIEGRARARPFAIAAVLLVIIGLVAGGLSVAGGSGCGVPADSSCLRVLFVGNSYTSTNDLPGTFAGLVRAGGRHVEVASVAPGGAALSDHAASAEVAAAISGTHWTAVVLQEQSLVPAAPELLSRQMVAPALTLVADARTAGAEPYVFQTWAHRDGWPERYLDRAGMQAAIDASYREVAARVGAIVVPAGDAWARAVRGAPGIALWQTDGSHPTPAGTYLAACVFYVSLTGASPVGLAETGGLPAADAALLQRIAAEP
jgi:hypothetical protein